jgi:ATP-dependent DNA ligase
VRRRVGRLEAWAQVIERGCEGYVAKQEASAYEGGRTRRWLKVKGVRGDRCRGPVAAGEDGTLTRSGVLRTMRLTNNQEAVCGLTTCADLR